jgi:hypothetical protein
MAGNSQSSEVSAPRVKSFECPSCGAAITLRTPGLAMTAVCDSCHSVIDVTDENYAILRRYFAAEQKHFPIIALGKRGKLRGKLWEVIGFMVRGDKASGFTWEEFLLFNPYYGYRWLTYSEGHWNFVQTLKEKPELQGWRSTESATFRGQRYKCFYKGEAIVFYVLGEFYWRVSVDKSVRMADYISPPNMVSIESDKTEQVWALSEYIEPKEVAKAFELKEKVFVPRRKIGPNQVSTATRDWNEIWKLWLLFIAFLTIAQIGHVMTSSNKELLRKSYSYVPNSKVPEVTTPVFTLTKDESNLKLSFAADMDNSWCYVSGELVNDTTGQTYPFERTCEYYHGYDGGESWSEGSNTPELIISSVPKGQYYINLDAESGSIPNINLRNYALIVTNDVPTYSNYFWCLAFISILPFWQWYRSRTREVERWSQSDFSPYDE